MNRILILYHKIFWGKQNLLDLFSPNSIEKGCKVKIERVHLKANITWIWEESISFDRPRNWQIRIDSTQMCHKLKKTWYEY